MAKKKVASRAAAQPAVKKKWSGHKTAAQILGPQDRQVEGEGRCGSQVEAGQEGAAEAAHRHQPSPRRGF